MTRSEKTIRDFAASDGCRAYLIYLWKEFRLQTWVGIDDWVGTVQVRLIDKAHEFDPDRGGVATWVRWQAMHCRRYAKDFRGVKLSGGDWAKHIWTWANWSLNAPIRIGSDVAGERIDFIESENVCPVDRVSAIDVLEKMKAREHLIPRQHRERFWKYMHSVAERRNNHRTGEIFTLQDWADEVGLSRERCRQLSVSCRLVVSGACNTWQDACCRQNIDKNGALIKSESPYYDAEVA